MTKSSRPKCLGLSSGGSLRTATRWRVYHNAAEDTGASLGRWVALTYLVVVLPLSIPLLTEATTLKYLPHVVNLGILLWIGVSQPQALSNGIARWYFVLFCAFAFSLSAQGVAAGRLDIGAFAYLAGTFVWFSPVVSIPALIRYRDPFARWMVFSFGVAVTLSVLVPAVADRLWGIQLGEVARGYGVDSTARYFGPLGDNVGFVLVLPAIWALAAGRWLAFLVVFSAVLLTGTRGALVSLAVGVFSLLWLRRSSQGSYQGRFFVGTVAVLVIGSAFASMPSNIAAWLQFVGPSSRYAQDALVDDATDRFQAMRIGLELFSQEPMTGVGFGRYPARSAPLSVFAFTPTTDLARGSWSAQNQLIQVAAEAGIPGIVAFIGFVWALVVSGRRISMGRRRDVTFAQALSSYVIAIAIGNQSAVWLLPMASSGYVLLAAAAISSSVSAQPAWRFRQQPPKQVRARLRASPGVPDR